LGHFSRMHTYREITKGSILFTVGVHATNCAQFGGKTLTYLNHGETPQHKCQEIHVSVQLSFILT